MKVWITSDTHFGHKNIVKGVSSWPNTEECRDFNSVEEHDSEILSNINRLVDTEDTLYHLGDFSFGGHQNIPKYRSKIKCRKIILIRGNHDEHIKVSDYWKGINYAQLFNYVCDTMLVKHGNHAFFLSHYSHQIWPHSHKGVLHCFGHSHNSLEGIGKSMDVGVDSAFNLTGEYRPFSIEEVIDVLSRKEWNAIDHHTGER